MTIVCCFLPSFLLCAFLSSPFSPTMLSSCPPTTIYRSIVPGIPLDATGQVIGLTLPPPKQHFSNALERNRRLESFEKLPDPSASSRCWMHATKERQGATMTVIDDEQQSSERFWRVCRAVECEALPVACMLLSMKLLSRTWWHEPLWLCVKLFSWWHDAAVSSMKLFWWHTVEYDEALLVAHCLECQVVCSRAQSSSGGVLSSSRPIESETSRGRPKD